MDFSGVPVVLLFIISLICCVASSNYKAIYIKKNIKNHSEYYSLNAGIFLCCAVLLYLLSGCDNNISTYSILLGCAFGAVTMASSICSTIAIKFGPYGYTCVILNLSTAITALSGFLFWNEKISIWQIIAIVLMLICFYLSIDNKNKEEKKVNIKWLILCFMALAFTAGVGLIQKVHQEGQYSGELIPFLCISFLVGAVLSYIIYFVVKKNEIKCSGNNEKQSFKTIIPIIIAILICGVGVAGNNAIDLYLAGVVDTAVFFPIVNSVPLLVGLLFSFFFFKEKLSKRQWLGLIVGIIAIVLLFF